MSTQPEPAAPEWAVKAAESISLWQINYVLRDARWHQAVAAIILKHAPPAAATPAEQVNAAVEYWKGCWNKQTKRLDVEVEENERLRNKLDLANKATPAALELGKVRALIRMVIAPYLGISSRSSGQEWDRLEDASDAILTALQPYLTTPTAARDGASRDGERLDWLEKNKLGVYPTLRDGPQDGMEIHGWSVEDAGIAKDRPRLRDAIDAAMTAAVADKREGDAK